MRQGHPEHRGVSATLGYGGEPGGEAAATHPTPSRPGGAIRVCLKTDHRNLHSPAAIRKLGAQHEGTLRSHRIRRDGTFRDTVLFSIVDRAWPAVRSALQARLQALRAAEPLQP